MNEHGRDHSKHSVSSSETSPANVSSKTWRVGTLTYTKGGLAILFAWLLWGDFAWSIKERSIVDTFKLVLRQYKASDFLISILVVSLPSIIFIVLGPIISYLSDRHRGVRGRRIPFLLVSTPIAALSMMGMGFSPFLGEQLHEILGTSSPGLNVSCLIFFGLFWTLFEFPTIIANSVYGGLINDVVPQSVIGRFYGLFRAISLIVGIVFNNWIIGHARQYYLWIFIGIGAIYGGGFSLMCFKVKEGEYPPVPKSDQTVGFYKIATQYFKDCFAKPFYLWVFLFYALSAIAFMPLDTFSIFNMDTILYGKCMVISYIISMVLSYFLGSLADRFHPLRMGILTVVLYIIVALWGAIFGKTTNTFAIALIAHTVLAGTFWTVTASIGQRLFPSDEFAQLSSAMTIFVKTVTFLAAPVVGYILDFTGHIYRYAFYAGFGLAASGLVASMVLHKKFMALGGPRHYVAPE